MGSQNGDTPEYARIGVRIDVSGGDAAVLEALQAVEAARPLRRLTAFVLARLQFMLVPLRQLM